MSEGQPALTPEQEFATMRGRIIQLESELSRVSAELAREREATEWHRKAMLEEHARADDCLRELRVAEGRVRDLQEALENALTWIENYPLNHGVTYDEGWRSLKAELEALVGLPE